MNRRERIEKIRELVRRGATEGERAAARAALERMGEPIEAPQQKLWMPAPGEDRSRPGAYYTHDPGPYYQNAHNYAQAKAQYQFIVDDITRQFTKVFDEFTERFLRMRAAGLTDTEITDMINTGKFHDWKENTDA